MGVYIGEKGMSLCYPPHATVFVPVPSSPPQSVRSFNTSSTSVNVTWLEVPTGFVHGILLGYRVFYCITQHQPTSVPYTIVSANKLSKELTMLKKFTNYTIQLAAYTRIGDGTKSPPFIVSTDEDGMKKFTISTARSFPLFYVDVPVY